MADLNGFDANQVDPDHGLEPLPAGKYLTAIIASEMKPTKSGDGSYLQLTFQVLDGPHKGRQLWARLNLVNRNEVTVKIARAELSALCRAVGVMTPKDSCELHNLPLLIKVRLKKRPDTGELENDVRGFAKKETGPAPQAANNVSPWRR